MSECLQTGRRMMTMLLTRNQQQPQLMWQAERLLLLCLLGRMQPTFLSRYIIAADKQVCLLLAGLVSSQMILDSLQKSSQLLCVRQCLLKLCRTTLLNASRKDLCKCSQSCYGFWIEGSRLSADRLACLMWNCLGGLNAMSQQASGCWNHVMPWALSATLL